MNENVLSNLHVIKLETTNTDTDKVNSKRKQKNLDDLPVLGVDNFNTYFVIFIKNSLPCYRRETKGHRILIFFASF